MMNPFHWTATIASLVNFPYQTCLKEGQSLTFPQKQGLGLSLCFAKLDITRIGMLSAKSFRDHSNSINAKLYRVLIHLYRGNNMPSKRINNTKNTAMIKGVHIDSGAIVNFPPIDDKLALTTAIELDAKAIRTHTMEGKRASTARTTIALVHRNSLVIDCCGTGRDGTRESIRAIMAR